MTINIKPLPSQALLSKLLDYDPEQGILTWKVRDKTVYPEEIRQPSSALAHFNKYHAGNRADHNINKAGYRTVRIFGQFYMAHRLIWKMMSGVDPLVIDHINRRRDDNRFVNLRDTTPLGNSWNRAASNVWQVKKNGLWRGQIMFRGHVIRICSFERREDAEKAVAAVREALFEFPSSPTLGANVSTLDHAATANGKAQQDHG